MTISYRPITREEWETYEWNEVSERSDPAGAMVFVQGIKKTQPPPPPDEINSYELIETTRQGDMEQSWAWVPRYVYETRP